jgi:ankyrin repeat protein
MMRRYRFLAIIPALCVAALSGCSRQTEGATILHWAASSGNIEIVKTLIENGKTAVDIRDRDGQTPLFAAADAGNAAIVEYLARQKADLGAKDNAGMTVLHHAAKAGQGIVIKLLGGKDYKDRIEPLLGVQDSSGNIPLALAVRENRRDAAAQLISLGSPVDAKMADGGTVLHWACVNGYEDVVKLLISRGAPLDRKDAKGRVPMHLAASAGHTRIVDLLINAGADPNVPWPNLTWFW